MSFLLGLGVPVGIWLFYTHVVPHHSPWIYLAIATGSAMLIGGLGRARARFTDQAVEIWPHGRWSRRRVIRYAALRSASIEPAGADVRLLLVGEGFRCVLGPWTTFDRPNPVLRASRFVAALEERAPHITVDRRRVEELIAHFEAKER